MGILWAHTGAIGCIVLQYIAWFPHVVHACRRQVCNYSAHWQYFERPTQYATTAVIVHLILRDCVVVSELWYK